MSGSIELVLARDSFAPNEVIRGSVSWEIASTPRKVSVVVGWYTAGKGTTDEKIEHRDHWLTNALVGSQSFEFRLPPAPYSFSGTLIELLWYVEATTEAGKLRTRTHFDFSPEREPVQI